MKKRIVAFVILVAMSAMIFSGCTFIKKNEEREANEVLATVTSDGITLTVTRNELLTYVNYMAQQYAQYGSTPDFSTLLPEIYDYLISQKYLIIKGMVYLKSLDHRKDVMAGNVLSGISVNTPEGVLTLAERYDAIKKVNETFQSEIDGYLEEYANEQRNQQISNVENQISLLKQQGYAISKVAIKEGSYKEEYLTTDKLDESKIFLNIHMTKGTDEEVLELPYSVSLVDSENAFTLELSSEESSKKVVTKNVVLKYEEAIEENADDTAYVTHKSEAVSYKLVKPRGTEPKEEEKNFEEGDIKGRYNKLDNIAAEDKAEYFNYSTASTKELNEAFRRFREAKKSMLINFEQDGLKYYYRSQFESAVLTAVQHELERSIPDTAVTDQMINDEYNVLYERQKEEYSLLTPKEQVQQFTAAINGSGEISLSNMYYVPEAALAAEGYDLSYFVGIAHILFKFDDTQTAFIKAESAGMTPEQLKELKNLVAQSTTTSRSNPDYDPEFEGEWDGEGIDPKLAFDPDGIDINVYGENSVYEALYAELKAAADGAERFEIFKKYMAYYNDDNGAFTSPTGYPIFPKGIKHSYDGDDFPELGRMLAEMDLSQGSVFLGEPGNEYIGYAFTSYGVHWMMISFVPFVEGTVEGNAITLNAVLNLKGDTHKTLIKDKLLETMRTNAYTEFTNSHTQEKALQNAEKNQKKFDKLMKDLGLDKKN